MSCNWWDNNDTRSNWCSSVTRISQGRQTDFSTRGVKMGSKKQQEYARQLATLRQITVQKCLYLLGKKAEIQNDEQKSSASTFILHQDATSLLPIEWLSTSAQHRATNLPLVESRWIDGIFPNLLGLFFPIHPYSNQTLLQKTSNNRIISQKSQGKNYCNQSSSLPSCYWAVTSSLPVISRILGGALLLYSSFSVVFVKHPRCLRRLLFFPRLQQ